MNTPDNWVVLKIDTDSNGVLYKVLAGWSGGYLDGDSWRLNSGITKCVKEGEYFLFHGESGSIYKCHYDQYRLRMNNAYIYNKLKEDYGDKIQMVDENTDWETMEWK